MIARPGRYDGRRSRGSWDLIGSAAAMALALGGCGARQGIGATPPGKPAAAARDEAPAAKTARDPLSYLGRVIEKATGKPVAGATVTVIRFVLPDPATGGKRILQQTTHRTDADGNYHFTTTPEQMAEPQLAVALRVEHPDYPPEEEYYYGFGNIRRDEARGDRTSFEVALLPGKPITGVVVTPDGKPAAGVPVRSSSFFSPGSSPGNLVIASLAETRTDGQGRFRLVVVTPGEGEWTLSPEGYAPSVRKLEEGRRGDLGRFVLRGGIVLKGKVLDAGGRPLAGVFVNAAGFPKEPAKDGILDESTWGDQFGSVARTAVTDAAGAFAMAPLPPGVYRVMPLDQDRDPLYGGTCRPLPAPFTWQKVTLKVGETPAPIEIRALPSVVVEARLRDSRGRAGRSTFVFLGGSLDVDGKGKAEGGLPELPLIGTDDRRSWSGNGWTDAEGRIVLHVPRSLRKAVFSPSEMTHGLRATRYRIGQGGPWRHGPQVTLPSLDRDVKDIEIVTYESPTIFVRVGAGDGSKIQGARVTAAYAEAREPAASATAFNDGIPEVQFWEQTVGRFRSLQLLPDETVTVSASAEGYRPRSLTLKLSEGAIRELDWVLDKK